MKRLFVIALSLTVAGCASWISSPECPRENQIMNSYTGECFLLNRWDFTLHDRSSGIDMAAFGEGAAGAAAGSGVGAPGPSAGAPDAGPGTDAGPDAGPAGDGGAGPGPGDGGGGGCAY